ncbi:LOW QUALITY PROTEIN: hypothetical protein M513_13203 [Trichuris suis]|uniref:Uncharacterized protein n=1 Tax=Trichuris suis TaxID=68888 RepID=A0A085LLS2_9BILA|nr:LOW QUALITY PROTEIN: hypothetical protein M513_13203 [Trichuris suis]
MNPSGRCGPACFGGQWLHHLYRPHAQLQTKQPTSLRTIIGDELRCAGVGTAKLEPREGQTAVVDVIVSERQPLGFDIVLGIHATRSLGAMFLDDHGGLQLGPPNAPVCAAADAGICVEGAEFVATTRPTIMEGSVEVGQQLFPGHTAEHQRRVRRGSLAYTWMTFSLTNQS